MSIKSINISSDTSEAAHRAFRSAFGEQFNEHVLTKEFFATGTGGVGEYVVTVETLSGLLEAVNLALAHNLEYRVVGGGTGSLMSDVGYNGLLIVNKTRSVIFKDGTSQAVVESGVLSGQLINLAVPRGLGGVEFLSAIPGTVVGALLTQASYQGKTILPMVREALVIIPNGQIAELKTVRTEELSEILGKSKRFMPVVARLTVQLSSLTQMEIMRRLQQIRSQTKYFLGRAAVGYPFFRALERGDIMRELERSCRSKGIQISGQNSNIWLIRSPQVSSAAIRQAVEAIRHHFVSEFGVTLEQRLSYLGYWPSEEENSPAITASSAESF